MCSDIKEKRRASCAAEVPQPSDTSSKKLKSMMKAAKRATFCVWNEESVVEAAAAAASESTTLHFVPAKTSASTGSDSFWSFRS